MVGDIDGGLRDAILCIIYANGQEKIYDTDWITGILKKNNYWGGRQVKTPERTVNSYFSQNPLIFQYVGPKTYRLRPEYYRKTEVTGKANTENKIADKQDIPIAAQAASFQGGEIEALKRENLALTAKVAELKERLRNIAIICKE